MLSYDQDESASPIPSHPTNKAQDRNRQLARDMLFQLLTRSWLSMIISITVTTWSRAPSSRLDVVVDSVSNFSWHPRQCSLSSTRTNTKREQTQNENKIKSAMTASRSSCSRCLLPCTFIHSFIHSFIHCFFLVSGFMIAGRNKGSPLCTVLLLLLLEGLHIASASAPAPTSRSP